MTSLPELGSPPAGSTAWRALLAMAVVFVMLATGGWTAARYHKAPMDPLAASFHAWSRGTVSGRRLPAASSPPRRLAGFFSSLTSAQRLDLVRRYPLAVGNLNGAPVTLRYRANRIALTQARARERRQVHDKALTPLGQSDALQRVHRYTSLLSDGRQILAFDPSGYGRAAEVFGDLSRASRVSVVVPGVDTNILTFEKSGKPYSAPVGMARSLYHQEQTSDPGGHHAVIAWADYTTPDGIDVQAATGALAADGAHRLRALVRGLPGDSRVSLMCHSYGSVVCGLAAHHLPGRVTDIAVAGSPGMRANHADDLGTHARVWAMRDPTDWIQDVPHLEFGGLGHGADPVSTGFGARVLSANEAHGHAGYFAPGTDSLANFADVGVGAVHDVDCAHGDDCTTGLA